MKKTERYRSCKHYSGCTVFCNRFNNLSVTSHSGPLGPFNFSSQSVMTKTQVLIGTSEEKWCVPPILAIFSIIYSACLFQQAIFGASRNELYLALNQPWIENVWKPKIKSVALEKELMLASHDNLAEMKFTQKICQYIVLHKCNACWDNNSHLWLNICSNRRILTLETVAI